MKHVFIFLAAIFCVNANAVVPTTTYQRPESALLNRFDVDSKLNVFNPNNGTITVDFAKKEVTLELVHAFKCGPRQACPMIMMAPYIVTLPITKSVTDICGIPHITAQKDDRAVDGDLETIEVFQNSASRCEYLVALAPTYLTYETISVHGEETRSSFSGEKFHNN